VEEPAEMPVGGVQQAHVSEGNAGYRQNSGAARDGRGG
jgi:hypothetical protein